MRDCDKLCGGSLAPILSHLAKSQRLTAEERQALRELINSPAATGKGSKRKG